MLWYKEMLVQLELSREYNKQCECCRPERDKMDHPQKLYFGQYKNGIREFSMDLMVIRNDMMNSDNPLCPLNKQDQDKTQ